MIQTTSKGYCLSLTAKQTDAVTTNVQIPFANIATLAHLPFLSIVRCSNLLGGRKRGLPPHVRSESGDFTQTCKRSSMTHLCSDQEMILKKNIEENGSQKTDFTPHFFKLCIHVLGKIFYKLLFWMGDTNKSHLFGRFICRSWCHWCHSIFHPEIDSTYVWGGLKFPPGQNVTSTTSKVWILEGSATCLISIFDGLWASPGVHGLQATNPQPLEGISVMNRMVAALLRLLTARLPLLRIVRPIISIGIRPLANDVAKDCKSM